MAFCGHCGTDVRDQNKFCHKCGSAMPDIQAAAPPATAPAKPPTPVPPPEKDGAEAVEFPVINLRTPTMIVIVVALAVIAWPVYGWAKSAATAPAATEQPVATPTPTPVPTPTYTKPTACTSSAFGFSYLVPPSWANLTEDTEDCTYYRVPLEAEDEEASLRVFPDAGPFAQVEIDGTTLKEQIGNVGDRPGVNYEVRYTDADGRWHALGYQIERDERTFVISLIWLDTFSMDDRTKAVFHEVVRSLDL